MLSVTYKSFMLSVIMLNVTMLNVIMLNVIMLNVIVLSVVVPYQRQKKSFKTMTGPIYEEHVLFVSNQIYY